MHEAEQRFGDRLEVLLGLIGHWAHRGGASALAELTRLEKKLAALPPEDTNLLQRALAEAVAVAEPVRPPIERSRGIELHL